LNTEFWFDTQNEKLFRYARCLSYHSEKGPPQRIDCLAPRWEKALSLFPKDTATNHLIGNQTKVSQPFDY